MAFARQSQASTSLATVDPEVFAAIRREERRQVEKIELIASENYTSAAVLEAQGSVLTNKYAEGYPGRRYYGGCEWVDVVERLARARAVSLFGADHANVQEGTPGRPGKMRGIVLPGSGDSAGHETISPSG